MALSPPTAPTAPDLNSPSTYNARVLAGFTYCFTTLPDWIAGLDASDWFSVQSSASDTTAGRVMTVGAGGLLDNDPPTVTDFDTPDYAMWFKNTTGTNAPGAVATSWAGFNMPFSSTAMAQIAYRLTTEELHIRGKAGGSFGGWKQFALQGNDADFADLTADSLTSDGVVSSKGGLYVTSAANTSIGLLRSRDSTLANCGQLAALNFDGAGGRADWQFQNSIGEIQFVNTGDVTVGHSGAPSAKLDVGHSQTSKAVIKVAASSTSFANSVQTLSCSTAASASYSFFAAYSSGGDLEAKISGVGNITADGTVAGGGADRAEAMEWLPRILAEIMGHDMRGITVVLEDGFIRPAEPGEEPIGVISDTYDTIGNTAPLKWTDKYLKDDLGSYIWEDYEVVEWVETVTKTMTETVQATEEITRARDVIEVENGTAIKRTITETVQVPVFDEFPMRDEAGNDLGTHRAPRMIEVERVTEKEVAHSYAADAVPEGVTVPEDATRTTQQRKVLNPDYDPAVEYTPRLERPEWDAVGVLGICRVLAGQPVAPTWIKMRDVSETVEEWLVR